MKTEAPFLARIVLKLLLPEEEREFFMGDLEEGDTRSWTREVLGAVSLRISMQGNQGPKRAHKGDGIVPELLLDLKHGLRLMIRSPGFTAVALLTMALGIGANTAIFSLVYGVLLKPLPFPEPEQLVMLQERNLPLGFNEFTVTPPDFRDWEIRNRSLEQLAAFRRSSTNYTGGDRPESLSAYRITEEFLPMLGGTPALGRGFTREDIQMDAEPTVILSHGLWERSFGGSREVLGQSMILDAVVYTIVGVLPEGWQFSAQSPADLLLPLTPGRNWATNRNSHFLYAVGRMKDGTTLGQTRAEFAALSADLEEEHPDTNRDWEALIRPLEEIMLGSVGSQLLIFLASVALVLLIACANLANMTLARATSRARELAIRAAMGAGRGRVIRQILAESLLLATVGGALGVGLAYLGLTGFVSTWPGLLPRLHEVEISAMVLFFSLALSLASGVVFGLVPAMNVARSNLTDTLRQGRRGLAGDRSRRWMRTTLVVGEVGMAVVLLIGTGLLIRSFSALQAEDPGFTREHRLILSTPLASTQVPSLEGLLSFRDAALSELSAIAGVEKVALSSLIPLEGSDQVWSYWLEERATPETLQDGIAIAYRVSPDYFQTIGIPLLAGRTITPQDRADGTPVVVISASMVERVFPDESPLGRRIRFGTDEDDLPIEIIGVVGDVQHHHVGQPSLPQLYVPFDQRPTREINWVLQTSVPPLSLVDEVRHTMGSVNPDLPILGLQPADAMVAESISTQRFRTLLMTAFGLMALLLAVVGLYGVMAYSVSQRTKEIGVRVALGATRESILALVFREGLPLVGIGLALGLASSLALGRILEALLFGVGTRDPVVFMTVPIILMAVAFSAMLIPAQRATRVDPVQTLGEE